MNEIHHAQANVGLLHTASQTLRAETKAIGTEIFHEVVKWTKIICKI